MTFKKKVFRIAGKLLELRAKAIKNFISSQESRLKRKEIKLKELDRKYDQYTDEQKEKIEEFREQFEFEMERLENYKIQHIEGYYEKYYE